MVKLFKNYDRPDQPAVDARFTRRTPSQTRFENRKPVLRYKRARIYSAQLGRFISRDPIGYVDGMSLYRGYFVPRGMDPGGESIVTPEQAARHARLFGEEVCKAKCVYYVASVIPNFNGTMRFRKRTSYVDCPSGDARACCDNNGTKWVDRGLKLPGWATGTGMVCWNKKWKPIGGVVSGTCTGLFRGTPNCPLAPAAAPAAPRPSTPGVGIGPTVIINAVPVLTQIPIPTYGPETKIKTNCNEEKEDKSCDCWCVGYQGTFEGTPTNIGWMTKKECLATSNIQEIPGELPYEEICACGEGWWE